MSDRHVQRDEVVCDWVANLASSAAKQYRMPISEGHHHLSVGNRVTVTTGITGQ